VDDFSFEDLRVIFQHFPFQSQFSVDRHDVRNTFQNMIRTSASGFSGSCFLNSFCEWINTKIDPSQDQYHPCVMFQTNW
jgi:hypothetical protein